ncbi:unnamed protein product [Sphagnum balticum]
MGSSSNEVGDEDRISNGVDPMPMLWWSIWRTLWRHLNASSRRHAIQGTTTIFDEWLFATVDVHDPQTHHGAVPDREAFVGCIFLFVEFHYLIDYNLKGFYVVTAHWINTITAKSKSLLLTIIDVASGRGVSVRVAKAFFEHLKGMGLNVLLKLLNVVSDNGSNAIATVKHMF